MSRSSTKEEPGFGIFRIVGMCAVLIGLSQFLIGGCGGGGSSSGPFILPKPKATIEAVAPIAESADVDTSNQADVFKVTLSKTSKSDVTVVFTVGGTATVVDDFDLITGTGENSVVIPVVSIT